MRNALLQEKFGDLGDNWRWYSELRFAFLPALDTMVHLLESVSAEADTGILRSEYDRMLNNILATGQFRLSRMRPGRHEWAIDAEGGYLVPAEPVDLWMHSEIAGRIVMEVIDAARFVRMFVTGCGYPGPTLIGHQCGDVFRIEGLTHIEAMFLITVLDQLVPTANPRVVQQIPTWFAGFYNDMRGANVAGMHIIIPTRPSSRSTPSDAEELSLIYGKT